MKLGFLGTGTIATAVIHGIAEDGHEITVSRRSASNARTLAARYANLRVADNQGVVDASDVVFVGLMAEAAPAILGRLTFRPDQNVISFMAGAALDRVGEMVAPAQAVALMLPYPGIAEGGSPIPLLGDTQLVGEIFGARNTLFPLATAAELDAYLCAQAVLSPVARLVEQAAAWLAPRVDDPTQGEAFLRLLVASNLGGPLAASQLIEALNTEGGYNQRLRQHMDRAGMGPALAAGLDDLATD